MSHDVWPGRPYPLGATFDGVGTHFAIFSEVATAVELCLFDDAGKEERLKLPESTAHCWHGYVRGVGPGQRYGFRVHGPWDPAKGQRCQPTKLLIDPYARAIDGDVDWNESLFSYRFGKPEQKNDDDSARFVPKCVVVNPWFDWGKDHSPNTPLHKSLIYEMHVKGFTRLMQQVPEPLRGTYAGLAHPGALSWLKKLGVTAVELMPVHQFVHDSTLAQKGLRNYWGYNTIGYFAPHGGYSASGTRGEQVQEFKLMVRELHKAGFEVILDVVYNHTAEGNHFGPTLSFKGIDNASYYRLMPDQQYFKDFTGTGNSFNMLNAHVLQLMMDSLRYWVTEMHVDGFRFDLASALARGLHEVDRLSAFFDLIHQDPVCRDVKLIAEPWDLGERGYQVGNFPPLWMEWNDRYRDTTRDFWRAQPHSLPEMASRLTGSSDLYETTGRRPYASINFVTAHDGFTLHDLVSYNGKHNEKNGEENRDGTDNNRSWNCGVEGDTQDPAINALRRQQKKNLLATLLLSQGIPMLVAGDELGHSQGGNNNAYAQDNETSWLDWSKADLELAEFTRRLIQLRKAHPTFRRRRFLLGEDARGSEADIRWLRPDGEALTDEDWNSRSTRAFGAFLNGMAIRSVTEQGERIIDDDFTLLFNPHHEAVEFVLPDGPGGVIELDTARNITPGRNPPPHPAGASVKLEPRSVQVLRHGR